MHYYLIGRNTDKGRIKIKILGNLTEGVADYREYTL